MNLISILGGAVSGFFGSSSNGKGIADSASDIVDKWMPSAETKQKNSIEDLKAGDESQESARAMKIAHHDSWFDILVDGCNRSVRPFVTYWVMGVLFGWWEAPNTGKIDPVILNIIWTVITFWFGSRVVFKDVPNAIAAFKEIKTKAAIKKKKEEKLKSDLEPFEDD